MNWTHNRTIRQGKAGYLVQEAIIHCSATRPNWMALNTFEEQVAELRRWHMQDRGWRDIGYHRVIGRNGELAIGRSLYEIGAHVAGHNAGTIGICLLGGHGSSATDRFEDHFTPEQAHTLRVYLADLASLTPLKKISGHNEYAAKACPGFTVRDEEWIWKGLMA